MSGSPLPSAAVAVNVTDPPGLTTFVLIVNEAVGATWGAVTVTGSETIVATSQLSITRTRTVWGVPTALGREGVCRRGGHGAVVEAVAVEVPGDAGDAAVGVRRRGGVGGRRSGHHRGRAGDRGGRRGRGGHVDRLRRRGRHRRVLCVRRPDGDAVVAGREGVVRVRLEAVPVVPLEGLEVVSGASSSLAVPVNVSVLQRMAGLSSLTTDEKSAVGTATTTCTAKTSPATSSAGIARRLAMRPGRFITGERGESAGGAD